MARDFDHEGALRRVRNATWQKEPRFGRTQIALIIFFIVMLIIGMYNA